MDKRERTYQNSYYTPVRVQDFPYQTPQRILVISDLHISEGYSHKNHRWNRRENFTFDEAFAEFLRQKGENAARENSRAWLIINGDFIDFLRVTATPRTESDLERWRHALNGITASKLPEQRQRVLQAFDEFAGRWRTYVLDDRLPKSKWPSDLHDEFTYGLKTHDFKSVYRLLVVREGHRRVFQALAEWLATGHRLTIVTGNHDQEFNQELVQAGFLWMLEGILAEEFGDGEEVVAEARLVANANAAEAPASLVHADDDWKVNDQHRPARARHSGVDFASPEFSPDDDGDDGISLPDIARGLSFESKGLEIDGAIRIEHGHRFEWLTWPGEVQHIAEHDELTLAPGSLFNRYLINHIEHDVPYLDNVKPVTRVLSYLAKNHPLRFLGTLVQLFKAIFRLANKKGPGRLIFAGAQFVLRYGLLAVCVIVILLNAIFHLTVNHLESARAIFEFIGISRPIGEWLLMISQMYAESYGQYLWKAPQFLGVHIPFYLVLAFVGLWFLLSHYYYKTNSLFFSEADLKREMSRGFAADDPKKPHYAICGHTHNADMQSWDHGILHLNAGCWTPVFEYEGGHVRDDLTMTFIELDQSGEGWNRQLARWEPHSLRETDLILYETWEQGREARRRPKHASLRPPGHRYTFEELTTLNKEQLGALMLTGGTPKLEEVVGYEYRGYNMNAGTKILGTRKFKKGFYGNPALGWAWGYNILVKQNKMNEPWIARPNDENPGRLYFFRVLPAGGGHETRYHHALFIDYASSGEYFALNPAGYTVDYLVYPDPQNHDLILGKSDAVIGRLRVPLGYFILERYNKSNYDRASHFFNTREMRTIEKFAEVFIEGNDEVLTPQQIAWNVDQHVERIASNRTRSVKMALFLMEYVLPPLAGYLPFSWMPAKSRREFIEATLMPSSRGKRSKGIRVRWLRAFTMLREKILRDLSRVRLLIIAGYYHDRRVYDSIGFTEVRQRDKYDEKDLQNIGVPQIPLYVPKMNAVRTEICVIGSGAGGAVVAYNAAAAGKDVILLEEGSYLRSADMNHHEGEMMARMFKEGGLQSTIDLDMTLLQGKTLGGSTAINNAICFRLNDQALSRKGNRDVLDEWQELGAHVDANALEQAYGRVEEMIRVRRISQSIAGENANILLRGWEKLRRTGRVDLECRFGLFNANLRNCIGCGYCITGCPYGRKLSMAETYIPQAVHSGARVITGCHAVGIEVTGNKATGVRAEFGDGRKLLVLAEKVVVSCGAIGSSVLLMKSGIGKNVGKRFSCNAATPMLARFSDDVNGYEGVQMPAYIDAGDFMLESWFVPPMSFAVTMPGWFRNHFERMKAYRHFASAGVLIGTEANGRIKGSSLLRNWFGPLAYRMSNRDLERLKAGMMQLARVYFAAGAEAVYPASFVDLEMRRKEIRRFADIQKFIDKNITKPDDLTLSSAHPQGGNPMSDDRRIGVVDSSFKVHGTDNLFVCDASVFPTSIGINPQLTIMAMADYATRSFIL